MTEINVLDYLGCPECKSSLKEEDKELVCLNCGKIYPIRGGIYDVLLKSTEEAKFRDKESKFNFNAMQEMYMPKITQLREKLKIIKPSDSSIILDLGCGGLWPSAALLKIYKDSIIFAVDISLTMLSQGGEIMLKALDIPKVDEQRLIRIRTNIIELPFKDAVIDIVIGTNILHHLEDPSLALSEVKRILRGNGRYMFVEPIVPLMCPWAQKKTVEFDMPLPLYKWKNAFMRANLEPEITCQLSPPFDKANYLNKNKYLKKLYTRAVSLIFPAFLSFHSK